MLGRQVTNQLVSRNIHVVGFVHSASHGFDESKYGDLLRIMQLDLANLESVSTLIESLIKDGQCPSAVYFCARGKVVLDETLRTTNSLHSEFMDDYLITILSPALISLKLIDKAVCLKKIVFLSSQYAQVAQDKSLYANPEMAISSIYSALKGAVISLVRALSVKAIVKGINVNVFSIGGIRESTDALLAQEIEQVIPLGRMLSATEVAHAVVQISEVFEPGIVGSNIVIDGGWTIV